MSVPKYTITEAGSKLKEIWQSIIRQDGGHCPVCDRWGKLNKFTMNRTLIRMLVAIYNAGVSSPDGWVNMPKMRDHLIHRSNQYCKLEYWGLLERDPDLAGSWRVTEWGEKFLLDRARIPDHVWVYNGEVHSESEEIKRCSEVLDSGFDYAEEMSSIWQVFKDKGLIKDS